MPGKKGHRGWGHIRQLSNKSRRFQASYIGPDFVRHYAPRTFTARMDAEAWLTAERRLIERDEWMPPKARTALRRATSIPLGEYAGQRVVESPRSCRDERGEQSQQTRSTVARLIEHQRQAARKEQQHRRRRAPAQCLAEEHPGKRGGEQRFERQHQRSARPAGTLQPPGKRDRSCDRPSRGDGEQSREIGSDNVRFAVGAQQHSGCGRSDV